MKALDELRVEHEDIKVMLNVLSVMVRQLATGKAADTHHLDQIMEFITVFVDQCHHGKEEELLFPRLVQAGVLSEGGPVGVMLQEHMEGRKITRAMRDALNAFKAGDASAGQSFAKNAGDYITLLRAHIDKENNVLYPMGEQLLDTAVDSDLVEGFETIEAQRIGAGKHDAFYAVLHDLKQRYL